MHDVDEDFDIARIILRGVVIILDGQAHVCIGMNAAQAIRAVAASEAGEITHNFSVYPVAGCHSNEDDDLNIDSSPNGWCKFKHFSGIDTTSTQNEDTGEDDED